MATATCFEDLEVWKLSMNIAVEIYGLLKECKDFGFKDQIQRACVSIPSNIAEGFDRKSNKEFCYFLYIARGSCAEVRTLLYLAKQLTFIEKEVVAKLIKNTDHISRMLYNIIKYRSSL